MNECRKATQKVICNKFLFRNIVSNTSVLILKATLYLYVFTEEKLLSDYTAANTHSNVVHKYVLFKVGVQL